MFPCAVCATCCWPFVHFGYLCSFVSLPFSGVLLVLDDTALLLEPEPPLCHCLLECRAESSVSLSIPQPAFPPSIRGHVRSSVVLVSGFSFRQLLAAFRYTIVPMLADLFLSHPSACLPTTPVPSLYHPAFDGSNGLHPREFVLSLSFLKFPPLFTTLNPIA